MDKGENKKKRRLKRLLLAIIPAVLIAIIVTAAVFIYYPMTANIEQEAPPIVFALGTNAGNADLAGQTIGVSLGANETSATITVHPTYQTSYYEDILHILNVGTTTYYVYVRVDKPVVLPGGYALLYVINGTTATYTVNLTTTGTTLIGPMPNGTTFQVDMKIYIPEGNPLVTTSASISVIYTPEANETPP